MPFDLKAVQMEQKSQKANLSVPKKFKYSRSHERSFDSFC
jgi:hypothetical protein